MENLPKAFLDFIGADLNLKYDHTKCECGEVSLLRPQELNKGVVWLDASDDENQAYIEIPAISLLKSCSGYDPEYILMWLTNEQSFGTWDNDHWELRVFPNVSWQDIQHDPLKYLNAGWYDYNNEYTEVYAPFDKYTKISGWPF